MKRLQQLAAACACLLGLASSASAQVSVAAVPFLTIEPGARGNGMGNSFAAIADDAFGPFWNPGGLGFMQDKQHVALEYSPWLRDAADDMYLTYAAYSRPIADLGVFSAHLHYLNTGTQIRTSPDSPDPIGEFSTYEYALALSYGTKLMNHLGVGLNIKVIHSKLADGGAGSEADTGNEGSGTTFAVDLGLLYRDMLIKGLNGAIVLQNLGPEISYVDAAQSDVLPRNLRLGLAYKAWSDDLLDITIAAELNKLLLQLDENINTQIGEQAILSGGAEINFMKMFAGRVGYYRDEEGQVKGATFGGGFRLKFGGYNGGLDFAFIPGGDLQDYNKKFSLVFEF